MKRLHVHIAVDNLADSIQFYSSLFASAPTVQKEDYAKWMLDDPRVNFAISQHDAPRGLNHLGIQVESETELSEMQARLQSVQSTIKQEDNIYCCYAKSNKYWVTDPQGIAWETFHTLDSIPTFGKEQTIDSDVACDMSASKQSSAPCCVPTSPSNGTQKCC